MESVLPFPVIRASKGCISDDLAKLVDIPHGTRGRFASIPAFVRKENGKVSKTRRQCTKEYKTTVVEKAIRHDYLKCETGRVRKGVSVVQSIGISLDEVGRMQKMQARIAEKGKPRWQEFRWPLVELGMTRGDCLAWLKRRGYPEPPRSACVFCPFHSDAEWLRLKRAGGNDWERVKKVDTALRDGNAIVTRDMKYPMYLHRSCVPIDEVKFDPKGGDREMAGECEGMCGN